MSSDNHYINFLEDPFTFKTQQSLTLKADAIQKFPPMEVPMSKWYPIPVSPIDAAMGYNSRKNSDFNITPLRIGRPHSQVVHNSLVSAPIMLSSNSVPVTPHSEEGNKDEQGNASPETNSSTSVKNGRYKCQCGVSFIKLDELYEHAANSCAYKSNICSICGRGFMKAQDLRRHRVVHTIETVFCEYCGEKFPRLISLTRHKKLCRGRPDQ